MSLGEIDVLTIIQHVMSIMSAVSEEGIDEKLSMDSVGISFVGW